MTRFLLLLSLAANVVPPASAAEVSPYTDPLPIGDYVVDVSALLERAFAYDGWSLQSQPDDNTHVGFISYKGYDITVRISANDQRLSMSLDSAFATGCGDTCVDLGEEQVVQWLVILRRAIALELTGEVRDQLAQQATEEN